MKWPDGRSPLKIIRTDSESQAASWKFFCPKLSRTGKGPNTIRTDSVSESYAEEGLLGLLLECIIGLLLSAHRPQTFRSANPRPLEMGSKTYVISARDGKLSSATP